METLEQTLKHYFGYDEFRPLQREIIQSILADHDTVAIMPTGGGKSLCYQLPALVSHGLTVVISPLISLMKDQVDTLQQNGIAADFLNSSLDSVSQQAVMHRVRLGQIKLLYVAPERLMTDSFLVFLQTLAIDLFAVDEAHCISHWGHDFRPEYRKLAIIKTLFPKTPILAVTATATDQVKKDIISELNLTKPQLYCASFNRPNLHYAVTAKNRDSVGQLANLIKSRPDQSGIVYCLARDTVTTLCSQLVANGISALPYHAGLSEDIRKKNQEAFRRDDVPVMVATIAFGMGIDKPNVRYVYHYDLPATIERYYQETGRAGRDGIASDCLLLFSESDRFGIVHFIQKKPDPKERELAEQKLSAVMSYAKTNLCRRKILLAYFGEATTSDTCGNCDNCLTPKQTFDGTTVAKKILTCVLKTGQRFGVDYIASILVGSKVKKIIANHHTLLPSYGLITDFSKEAVKNMIDQLAEQDFVRLTRDQYPVLKLTMKAKILFTEHSTVTLVMPPVIRLETAHETTLDVNQTLFQKLRILRKQLADKAAVPPYAVFSDQSLLEMASYFPQTAEQFLTIYGVGQQKLQTYGDIFLPVIKTYCTENNLTAKLKSTNDKSRSSKRSIADTQSKSSDQTVALYRQGKSIAEIAQLRQFSTITITNHLYTAYLAGEAFDIDQFVAPEKQPVILQTLLTLKSDFLRPIKDTLGNDYSYEEIKWVKAKMQKEQRSS